MKREVWNQAKSFLLSYGKRGRKKTVRKYRVALHMCFYNKVFCKYAGNLQENTHAEVWLQQSCNALQHGCSPVNLLHIFRTPFPKKTFGELPLYKNHNTFLEFIARINYRNDIFSFFKLIHNISIFSALLTNWNKWSLQQPCNIGWEWLK